MGQQVDGSCSDAAIRSLDCSRSGGADGWSLDPADPSQVWIRNLGALEGDGKAGSASASASQTATPSHSSTGGAADLRLLWQEQRGQRLAGLYCDKEPRRERRESRRPPAKQYQNPSRV